MTPAERELPWRQVGGSGWAALAGLGAGLCWGRRPEAARASSLALPAVPPGRRTLYDQYRADGFNIIAFVSGTASKDAPLMLRCAWRQMAGFLDVKMRVAADGCSPLQPGAGPHPAQPALTSVPPHVRPPAALQPVWRAGAGQQPAGARVGLAQVWLRV